MTFPIVSLGVGDVAGGTTISLRQGDRLPSLVMQVTDEFGDSINLVGFTAWLVTRRVESADGAGLWGTPLETLILDPPNGVVVYDWQPEDTENASPGIYELVVEIRDGATGEHAYDVPTRRDTFLSLRSDVPFPLIPV